MTRTIFGTILSIVFLIAALASSAPGWSLTFIVLASVTMTALVTPAIYDAFIDRFGDIIPDDSERK